MNLITVALLQVLCEGYSEAHIEFAAVSDDHTARQMINTYKELVNRNQVHGNERNIDYWRKQGWEVFQQFVTQTSQQKSTTQIKRGKATGQSIVIDETDDWLIVVPVDKHASCYHGKHTDWCTTKPYAGHYEQYVFNHDVTLIYCLQPKTGKKWAIVCYPGNIKYEYFDSSDEQLTVEQFKSQTGLDPVIYQEEVGQPGVRTTITTMIKPNKDEWLAARRYVDAHSAGITSRSSEMETQLLVLNDRIELIKYCLATRYRWTAAEQSIASTLTRETVTYAMELIPERWSKLEALFTKTFRNVLPSVEYGMIVVGQFLVPYCKAKIPGDHRLREIEPFLIAGWQSVAGYYAADIIGGQWLELEQSITDDNLLWYAGALDEPYPSIEARISNMKISTNTEAASGQFAKIRYYVNQFYHNQPIPDMLTKLMSQSSDLVILYASVNKVRLPAGEHRLIGALSQLSQYIRHIQKTLPDAEFDQFMLTLPISSRYTRLSDTSNPFVEYVKCAYDNQRWIEFEHKLNREVVDSANVDAVISLASKYATIVKLTSWKTVGCDNLGKLLG